jgi:3-dehydrotetronate 4-kinase
VIVCPAFPANGRTVYQGHLFVGEKLLQDSSMRDHPLTPMTGSNLVALMAAQSHHPVDLIAHATVVQGADAIGKHIAAVRADGIRYFVADAICDGDLMAIGAAAREHVLVTGGSALAMGLVVGNGIAARESDAQPPRGRAIILAGSCSAATREQLRRAREQWPHLKLDMDRMASGVPVASEAAAWIAAQPAEDPVVVYGSADPAEVRANQDRFGRDEAGAMMEHAMSDLVRAAVGQGVARLIVAGGETSGAVVSALGIEALEIGREIAPGVPWTRPLNGPKLELALKSGNFGGPDFFSRALDTPF